MSEEKKEHLFFHHGAITPEMITKSIAKHSSKKNIGAHQIFLGQVRDDIKDGKQVVGINYYVYPEMAIKKMAEIRLEILLKHKLTCAHILHSEGLVNAGEICFFVFVSSPHRNAAMDACKEMVNRIKADVPIFGKELFADETYQWKENKS